MVYEYVCHPCGYGFEENQYMMAEHKAICPKCGERAQRVYSKLAVIWAGAAFRRDGSYRQDKDYAPVMRG